MPTPPTRLNESARIGLRAMLLSAQCAPRQGRFFFAVLAFFLLASLSSHATFVYLEAALLPADLNAVRAWPRPLLSLLDWLHAYGHLLFAFSILAFFGLFGGRSMSWLLSHQARIRSERSGSSQGPAPHPVGLLACLAIFGAFLIEQALASGAMALLGPAAPWLASAAGELLLFAWWCASWSWVANAARGASAESFKTWARDYASLAHDAAMLAPMLMAQLACERILSAATGDGRMHAALLAALLPETLLSAWLAASTAMAFSIKLSLSESGPGA